MTSGSVKHSSNGDRKYKITATRHGLNDYSFKLTDMNDNPADLTFDKDISQMHHRDYYLLEFQLHNAPGCDLEFINDRDKVLSACSEADAIHNCAPEGSNFLPTFYLHPTKRLEKKKLYVINTDSHVEKFYFGFSFVSRTGSETAYMDPGGDNQDRGLGRVDTNSFLLISAISGGVAAAGTVALVSNAFEPGNVLIYAAGGAVIGLILGAIRDRL